MDNASLHVESEEYISQDGDNHTSADESPATADANAASKYIKNDVMRKWLSPESEEILQAATTFEGFPKLPLELRRMIWTYACFVPRNIDVWAVSTSEEEGFDEFDDSQYGAYWGEITKSRSHNPVPPILNTSSESREIGLQHYSLSFGTDHKHSFGFVKIEISFPPKIYVNFDCDIICPINTSPSSRYSACFLEHLSFTDLPVRRLALPTTSTWDQAGWQDSDMLLRHDLDEVILYAGRPTSFKDMETFYDPADATPFSMEFISLEAAKEEGLIGNVEYDEVAKTLQEAIILMEDNVSDIKTHWNPEFRREVQTAFKGMYLQSSRKSVN
jgi:hypothetical protein